MAEVVRLSVQALGKDNLTGTGDIVYPATEMHVAIVWPVTNTAPRGSNRIYMLLKVRIIEKRRGKGDKTWVEWHPLDAAKPNGGFRIDHFVTVGPVGNSFVVSGASPQEILPQETRDIVLTLSLPGTSVAPGIRRLWESVVGDEFKVEPELYWVDANGDNILEGEKAFDNSPTFDPAFKIIAS